MWGLEQYQEERTHLIRRRFGASNHQAAKEKIVMVKAEDIEQPDPLDNLFEAAMSDPDAVPSVSRYIRTGKRWDITHKECRDKLIVIRSAKEINTRYGPAMLVQVDIEGLEKSALFGSSVLTDQVQELGPNLPVLAVIRKPNRAYTLTDPTPDEIAAYRKEYRS